jgi:hypothetical protein
MNQESKLYRQALESQLDHLRQRLDKPDADQWRKMGKWAQDFDLWLERARPWIPCASRLISLRVEQIVRDYAPGERSDRALRKFSNLLEEAFRQLRQPGGVIQVLDLEPERASENLEKKEETQVLMPYHANSGTQLPFDLIMIPEQFQPEGNPPVHFRYIIPN